MHNLLRQLDRRDEARTAFEAALQRTWSEPERRFLDRRIAELWHAVELWSND